MLASDVCLAHDLKCHGTTRRLCIYSMVSCICLPVSLHSVVIEIGRLRATLAATPSARTRLQLTAASSSARRVRAQWKPPTRGSPAGMCILTILMTHRATMQTRVAHLATTPTPRTTTTLTPLEWPYNSGSRPCMHNQDEQQMSESDCERLHVRGVNIEQVSSVEMNSMKPRSHTCWLDACPSECIEDGPPSQPYKLS